MVTRGAFVLRLPAHGLFRLAFVAGAMWLLFYATWLAFGPDGQHARMVFGDTAYLVPVAAAAALSVAAARRSEAASRPFWQLVALSNALWLAAEAAWSARDLIFGSVPFPWWTDAGYLSSYALLIPALLTARRPKLRAHRLAPILDALLLTATLAYVWWLVLLRPLEAAVDARAVVSLLYPAFGLVLLALLVSLELLPARELRVTSALFAAAVAATAVTDGLYTHAVINHSYLSGAWLDLGWELEAVLLSLAAVAAIAGVDQHGERQLLRPPRRLNPVVLVTTAMLILVASLVGVGLMTQITAGVAVGAGIVSLIAVARIVLGLGTWPGAVNCATQQPAYSAPPTSTTRFAGC